MTAALTLCAADDKDESGRRILVAWMGVPDQDEQSQPTIPHQWVHCMTLPRELHLQTINRSKPVEELRTLRQTKNAAISLNQGTENWTLFNRTKLSFSSVRKLLKRVLRFPSGVQPDSYTIKQKAS
ncbi:hypothetical protein PO124_05000 [Bacillus licheniformis]|nr:hypothetical protein [Bacillus licheniformis]